jgi:hypothetical protein
MTLSEYAIRSEVFHLNMSFSRRKRFWAVLVLSRRRVSGVDFPHGPSDCASVLHHEYSRYTRLLQDKLGFEYLGTWQDPPVYSIVARDQRPIHFRCAEPPTANPDKLLDAYLFVEDADSLYAEYAARGANLLEELPICRGSRASSS